MPMVFKIGRYAKPAKKLKGTAKRSNRPMIRAGSPSIIEVLVAGILPFQSAFIPPPTK
jgi:hypothetical protein